MGTGAGPRTSVAVLTYRRDHLLPDLLDHLVVQAAGITPPASVVVVDNDPDGGARGTVARWADRGVRYVHEPTPGISAGRNRALDEAADADVLVFIDDDELPLPGWLSELVGTWRRWRCAAVAGPVTSQFASPPDAWVEGSGLFDRVHRPTGTLLGGAATNNLLLDMTWVRRLGLRFDPRLGLTGGEDTLLTHALVHAGGEIRWSDEALVTEIVPADRLTRGWVLRRSFRSGSSWSRAEVHLAGGPAARLRLRTVLALRTAVRIPQAALTWCAAAVRRDVPRSARAVRTIASYAGLVAGAFGYVYGEYARPAAGS